MFKEPIIIIYNYSPLDAISCSALHQCKNTVSWLDTNKPTLQNPKLPPVISSVILIFLAPRYSSMNMLTVC